MPTVTFNLDFIKEDLGQKYSSEEISHVITQLGTEVEGIEDDKITVEVFPNRPDYLSRGGLIEGLKGWLDEEKGIPKIRYKKSSKKLFVKKAVEDVRPITHCFIAKNCELTEALVNELITIQEKLHITYGRKRKKCAIGLYDADKIQWPITYTAKKPEEIQFQPLGENKELTGKEIVEETKKGKAYGHLLDEKSKYPVFIDSNNDILSLPPIINSQKIGNINPQTKNIFVECSGNNHEELKHAIHILARHFNHIGADLEKVSIQGTYTKNTPEEEKNTVKIDKKYVNNRLGTDLTTKDIKKYVEKARHSTSESGENINVNVDNVRKDILHKADIVEDIAIQIGYENLKPDRNYAYSQSKETNVFTVKQILRDVALSQGLEEVYTFSLINKEKAENLDREPIEVKNSVSKKYNSLKESLVHSMLDTLSTNTSSNYPQNLFEIGTVFKEDKSQETRIKEVKMLSVAFCHKETTVNEAIEFLKKLEEEFDIEINIETKDIDIFIPGRSGQIIDNNTPKGIFGEIHPEILNRRQLSMPVTYIDLPITLFL